MDNVNETGFRGSSAGDLTASDVKRHYEEAEEAMAKAQADKEAGVNYSTHPGVLMEDNARRVASPAELALMAQMEAKKEQDRLATIQAHKEDIAVMRAKMEQHEMADRQAELQGAIPQIEPATPTPIRNENPVTAFFKGLKGLFTQRKPA